MRCLFEARCHLGLKIENILDGRKVARVLVQMQFENLGMDYLMRRNDYIEAVTLKDTLRVARRLLHPDRMRVIVVGDPEDLASDGL